MYTLRKISKHNIYNQSLGNSYSVVSKEFHKSDFNHYLESVFGKNYKENDVKNIVKFIITDAAIPIYSNEFYYVMTDNGSTFETINNPLKNK